MVKLLALLGFLAVGSEAAINVVTTYDASTDTTQYAYSGLTGGEEFFVAHTCAGDPGTVTSGTNTASGQTFDGVLYTADASGNVTVSIPRKAVTGKIAYFTNTSAQSGYVDGPTCEVHPALVCGASSASLAGNDVSCAYDKVIFSVSAASSSGYTSLSWSSAITDATISDASAQSPIIQIPISETDNYHCNQSIVTTLTVTDLYGNEESCDSVTTINDNSDPVLHGSFDENLTVECDDIPAAPSLTASDNCGHKDIVKSEVTNPNSIVNSWILEDWCGRKVTKTQTVTIEDTTQPTLVGVPTFTTAECGAVPQPCEVTAHDNCDDNLENVTFTESSETATTACSKQFTRQWSIADETGNAQTSIQTITVIDNIPPSIEGVPSDITIGCESESNFQDPVVTGSDQCDGSVDVNLVKGAAVVTGDQETTEYAYTAIDACGLSTSSSFTLTVEDKTPPVISGVESDRTIDIVDQNIDDSSHYCSPSVKDNCDATVQIEVNNYPQGDVCNTCGCERVIEFSALDAHGNYSFETQKLTYKDDSPPTMIGLGLEVVQAECDDVPTYQVSCHDENKGNVDVTSTNTLNPSSCDNEYDSVTVYSCHDNCGNATTQTVTLQVKDSEVPTFLPGQLTEFVLDCSKHADVASLPDPIATDNCSTTVTITSSATDTTDISDTSTTCGGTIFTEYVAEDECGNKGTHTVTATLVDNSPPGIDATLEDKVYECDAVGTPAEPVPTDDCSKVTTTSSPSTTDSCVGGSVTVTTYTYEDACGNQSTQVRTVTIEDTTPPIIANVPQGLQQNDCLSVPTLAEEVAGMVAEPASFTDACSSLQTVASLASNEESDIQNNGCTTILTRSVNVTDDCGNESTAQWTLETTDTTAPVVSNQPAHLTLNAVEGEFVKQVGWTCNFAGTSASSTVQSVDECKAACSANDCLGFTFNTSTGACVVDAASDACSTLVSSADVQYYSKIVNGVVRIPDVLPNKENALAIDISDGCESTVSSLGYVEESTAGVNDCAYTITRTWAPEDACGNKADSYTQTITVSDLTPPVVNFDTTTANCGCEDTACYAKPANIDFTDCGETFSVEATKINYVSQCEGGETFTWKFEYTDAANNAISVERDVVITDTVPPTITGVPSDDSMECGGVPAVASPTADDTCKLNGDYTITVHTDTQTGALGANASVIDGWSDADASNCSGLTSGEVSRVGGVVYANNSELCSSGCCSMTQESAEVVRTYTTSDDCGMNTTATYTTTIYDTTGPDVGAGSTTTRDCEAHEELTDKLDGFTTPSCTDTCVSAYTKNSFTESTDCAGKSAACTKVLNIVTLCMDDSGNYAESASTIEIVDNTPPEILTTPEDDTVQCAVAVPAAGTTTVRDDCTADANITLNTPVADISNNGTPNDEVHVFTYTAEDSVGNISSSFQTITVKDTEKPDIVVSPDSNDFTRDCSYENFGTNGESVEYSDNCTAVGQLTTSFTEATISQGACSSDAVWVRTWSASDLDGNSHEVTQTVTIQDNAPPSFDSEPASSSVAHNVYVQPSDLTANDTCDNSVTVTCTYIDSNSSCDTTIVTTVSCEAVDDCGLKRSYSYTITREDTIAPELTFTAPDAETVECDGTEDQTATAPSYTLVINDGETESNHNVDTTSSTTGREGMDGKHCYTKTWQYIVSDCVGNSNTYKKTVTVEDTGDPELVFYNIDSGATVSAPVDASYSCTSEVAPITWDVKAVDDCAGEATPATPGAFTVDIQTTTIYTDEWFTTYFYGVQDLCGNVASHEFTVSVNDNIPPELDHQEPANLEVEWPNVPPVETCVYTDNCSGVEEFDCLQTSTRTNHTCEYDYDIDVCYNSQEVNGDVAAESCYKVKVRDTTPPVLHALPASVQPASLLDSGLVYTNNDEINAIIQNNNAQPTTVGDDRLLLHFSGSTWDQTISVIDTRVWQESVSTTVPPVTGKDTAQNEDLTVNYDEQIITHNAIAEEYDVTRTWSTEDQCGNSVTYVQKIFVRDLVPPPALGCIPADISIPCNETDMETVVTFYANLYENDTAGCDWEEIDRVRTVGSQVVQTDTSCEGDFSRSYTYTVYDIVGNFIEQAQTIIVYDNEAPVFSEADITAVTSDSSYGQNIDFCAYTGAKNISATDACKGIETTVNKESVYTYPNDVAPFNTPYDQGGFHFNVEHKYTTTDDCGNSDTYSYTETIRDLHYPELTCVGGTDLCQAEVTHECGTSYDLPSYTAEDGNYANCGAMSLDVVETNTTVASTASPRPSGSGCNDDVHKIIHTFTATDDAGNSSQERHTIAITDSTPPTLSASAKNMFDKQEAKVCDNSELFTKVDGRTCFWQDVTLEECAQKCLDNETVDSCSDLPATQQNCVDFQFDPVNNKCHFSTGCSSIIDNTATPNAALYTRRTTSLIESDVGCLVTSLDDVGITADSFVCNDDCATCSVSMTPDVQTSSRTAYGVTMQYLTGISAGFTATDECGFTSVESISLAVEADTAPPSFNSTPEDLTVECGAATGNSCGAGVGPCYQDRTLPYCVASTGTCAASDSTPNRDTTYDFSDTLVGGDNCWSVDYTTDSATEAEVSSDNCKTVYTQTFTLEDNTGLTNEYVRTVTVQDTTPPQFVGVPAVDTTTFTCTRGDDPVITGMDDCSVGNISKTDTTLTTCNTSNFEQLVEYVVTDTCGLTATYVHTIVVEDVTKPEVGSDPTWTAQGQADHQCEAPEVFSPVPFTDACYTGAIVFDFEEITTDYTNDYNFTIERKWTVYDDADKAATCTNSVEHVQTITVADTTEPEINFENASVSLECNATIPTTYDGEINDTCDLGTNVPVLTSTSTTQDDSGDDVVARYNYQTLQTWELTDVSGITATSVQTYVISDSIPPEISLAGGYNFGETYYVDCNLTETLDMVYGNFSGVDNCDIDVELSHVDTIVSPVDSVLGAVGSCEGRLTEEVKLCATDTVGNVSSRSVTISAEDHTPPTFDNVGQVPDIRRDVTHTYIHWVVDTENKKPVGGHMLEKSGISINDCAVLANDYAKKLFYFEDGTCVVPTEPEKHTCTCEVAAGNTYKVVEDDDTWFSIGQSDVGKVTGLTSQDITDCEALTDGQTFQRHSLVFTKNDERSSDPDGYGLCSRDWNDKTTPLASDCCVSRPQWFIVVSADIGTVEGVTTDRYNRCSDENVPSFVEGGYVWEFNTNGTKCLYDIRDLHEDTGNCCVDPFHPQGVSPSLMTDGSYTCASTFHTLPTASDDCSADVTVEVEESTISSDSSCDNVVVERTYTASDDCNQFVTHVQTITIRDRAPPSLSGVPISTEVDGSAECGATFDADVYGATYTVTATDGCAATPTVTMTLETKSLGCTNSFEVEYTWSTQDDCGNNASEVSTITFMDNTPPEISISQNSTVTVECSDDKTLSVAFVSDECMSPTTIGTAFKGGDLSVPELTLDATQLGLLNDEEKLTPFIASVADSSFTIHNSYSYTDDCGNDASFVQTVVVVDTTPPEVTAPEDKTYSCASEVTIETVTATDKCDETVTTANYVGATDIATSDCDNGTKEHKWFVTDRDGNETTVTSTVVIKDETPPTLTGVPSNADANCNSVPVVPKASATDTCDGSMADVEATVDSTFDGSCHSYTLTYTYATEDACGNKVSDNYVVTVKDEGGLVITVPNPENTPTGVINFEDVGATWPGDVTAEDDCGFDDSYGVNFTESVTDKTCPHTFTLNRSWDVKDTCGNVDSYTQVIQVQDITPPTITPSGANQITEVNEQVRDMLSWAEIAESYDFDLFDNSNDSIDITITDKGFVAEGSNYCSGTHTADFIATDACNNSATFTMTVTIVDTTVPQLSEEPADATFEIDEVPLPCTVTTIDESCSTGVAVTFLETDQSPGKIRTWTATDASGNTKTHVQTITILDTVAPAFTRFPADETLECDCFAKTMSNPTIVAIDNDPANTRPTVNLVEGEKSFVGTTNNYTQINTWTANDASGNVASYNQTITVTDTKAPKIVDSTNVTPYTTLTIDCAAALTGEGTVAPVMAALDDCDTGDDAPTLNFNSNVIRDPDPQKSSEDCQTYTVERSWDATDKAGNTGSFDQTVTVQDNNAPTCLNCAQNAYCLYDNDMLHGFDVSEIFDVVDDCSAEIAVSITACMPNYDQVPQDGTFDAECFLDDSGSTLYIKGARDDENSADREFFISALTSDSCNNSEQIVLSVSVPSREAALGMHCFEPTVDPSTIGAPPPKE